MCILLQQPCGLSGFPGLEVWWLGCCCLMVAFLSSGGVARCRGVFQHPPHPRACLQAARVEISLATKHLFLKLVAKAAVVGF